jgi:hypothetical protein
LEFILIYAILDDELNCLTLGEINLLLRGLLPAFEAAILGGCGKLKANIPLDLMLIF